MIDPKPFSEEEDRAAEFGLQAVPLSANGEALYFGLAGTNSTDGREIIGFFQPDKEEFLEYDIASLIHRLGNPKRPVVGLMSSLPVDASFDQMSGRMQEGWASIGQLREQLEVRTVATDIGADRQGRRRADGRASEKPVAADALCDRPVRHARRQADRFRRSAVGERSGGADGQSDGDGLAFLIAGPAARCLGCAVRPSAGTRRS